MNIDDEKIKNIIKNEISQHPNLCVTFIIEDWNGNISTSGFSNTVENLIYDFDDPDYKFISVEDLLRRQMERGNYKAVSIFNGEKIIAEIRKS